METTETRLRFEVLNEDFINRGIAEYEGYSRVEMDLITFHTFGPDCPLQFQKLPEQEYSKIPLLNQVRYLCNMIAEHGEVKLTDKGYLPKRIVSELYSQGFMKEEKFENGKASLCREKDAMTITLTRIIMQEGGLTQTKNGKLSLTKAAESILAESHELLSLIFYTFTNYINWWYYDPTFNKDIAQLGYGYSLVLLSKYGHNVQTDTFYAWKYFTAYPSLLWSFKTGKRIIDTYTMACYSRRTFNRFLDFFGVIEIEEIEGYRPRVQNIVKTDLFDKMFACTPHFDHPDQDRSPLYN